MIVALEATLIQGFMHKVLKNKNFVARFKKKVLFALLVVNYS